MRSFLTRGLTLVAVGALLLGAPTASFAGGMNKDKSATDKTTTSSPTTGQTTDSAGTLSVQGEKLVGKEVYGSDGKSIGQIMQVEVDPSGSLKLAVVDVGSFLGLGTRQIAVAASDLKMEGDKITAAGMTKEKAENAPAYTESESNKAKTK